MADKNIDAKLAENEEQRKKLETEAGKLKAENLPQYPKHVKVACGENDPNALRDADGKPYQVVEVKSEAEEKAATSKKGAAMPSDAVTGTDTKAAPKGGVSKDETKADATAARTAAPAARAAAPAAKGGRK